jgi:hypothetical protein
MRQPTGREFCLFLQSHPIRFQGGDVNIYRYVGNGVLIGIDPFGLCVVKFPSICPSGPWCAIPDQVASNPEFSKSFYESAKWGAGAFAAIPFALDIEVLIPSKLYHFTSVACMTE